MANHDRNSRTISSEAVRAHLDRILASETFANSDRLRRFLRFAVEAELRGEADKVKEYVIGREVFDRNDSYDPRLDPIVRVEARRLRTKLDEYYGTHGRDDTLRIGFRKGSYTPIVEPVSRDSVTLPLPSPRTYRWAIGLIVVLVACAALLYFSRSPSVQRIAVAPARWISWESGNPTAFEENLVEAITGELSRRPSMQVISWPSLLPYRNARKRISDIATELRADAVLVVSAASAGEDLRVTLHLVNAITERKIWWADYRRSLKDAFSAPQELARLIAQELEAFQRSRK